MEINKEAFSIYMNLLKTVIGVGILIYPVLIKQYGFYMVLLYSSISAFFSASGLILYVLVNEQINQKSTMSSVAAYIVPKLQKIVDICVALKCFGVGVIYMIIVRDCIHFICQFFKNQGFNFVIFSPNIFLLFLFILLSPLSFIDKISRLRHTSLVGSISIIGILLLNFLSYLKADHTYSLPQSSTSFPDFSSFVYGFTCHQNIFSVQNEMKKTNVKILSKIIVCVMCSTIVIYLGFGMINYRIYGDRLAPDNIFELYCKDNNITSITVCFLFAIMLLLSLPLQIIPARMHSLAFIHENSNTLKYCITMILLISTYLLAICDFGVKRCMSLVGGSVSSGICFIFCSIYYLKLRKTKMRYKTLAITTLIFGNAVFLVFVFKTLSTFLDL